MRESTGLLIDEDGKKRLMAGGRGRGEEGGTKKRRKHQRGRGWGQNGQENEARSQRRLLPGWDGLEKEFLLSFRRAGRGALSGRGRLWMG